MCSRRGDAVPSTRLRLLSGVRRTHAAWRSGRPMGARVTVGRMVNGLPSSGRLLRALRP